MKLSARFAFAALPILLASSGCGNAASPVAKSTTQAANEPLRLQGWVNDAAGILSAQDEARLSRKLQALERRTKHQMVVVTTPSLQGETVSAYTLALAKRWGIGRKDINDGIVLLVAPHERQARIEVGYGLETPLTNERCAAVMNEKMVPRFRTADYAAGLEAGIDALSAYLQ